MKMKRLVVKTAYTNKMMHEVSTGLCYAWLCNAASDALVYAEEISNGIYFPSKVSIQINDTLRLSFINFVLPFEEDSEAQATIFEVAVHENGEFFGGEEHCEEYFTRLTLKGIKAMLKALGESDGSDITAQGLVNLCRYNEGR